MFDKPKSQLKESLTPIAEKSGATVDDFGFLAIPEVKEKKTEEVPAMTTRRDMYQTTMRKAMQMDGEDLNKVYEQDVESNKIDFNDMLNKYRKRTEHTLPFTKMEIKDTMFLDNNRLVCLEYIYYSEQGKYSTLIARDKEIPHIFGEIEDEKDPALYNLNPQCFDDELENFLDQNKELMTDENDVKVEILLSIWSINSRGQLIKDKEANIQYRQPLSNLKGLKLKLQLSNDGKYIFLPILLEDQKVSKFGQFHFKHLKLELQAWKADNLEVKKFPKHLTDQFNKLPPASKIGQLDSIKMVSRNKYLVIKFKTSKEANLLVFSTMTGECCNLRFEFNKPIRQHSLRKPVPKRPSEINTFQDEANDNNRFLVDVLVDEESHVFADNQESDSSFDDECNEEEESSQGQDPQKHSETVKFGFDSLSSWHRSGTVFNQRSPSPTNSRHLRHSSTHKRSDSNLSRTSSKLRTSSPTLADALRKMQRSTKEHVHHYAKTYELTFTFYYIGNKPDSFQQTQLDLGCYKYNLQDILAGSQRQGDDCDLNDLGFPNYVQQDLGVAFDIPRDWFLTQSNTFKKWQSFINLTANKNCTKIGVLNQETGDYIGYDVEARETLVKLKLNPNLNQIAEFVRNQETKFQLMLNVRNSYETRTDVLISQSEILSINFQTKYNLIMQDTQVIEKNDNILLQSIKVSASDHELIMKTQVQTNQDSNEHYDEIRKSVSQRIVASYPVIMYNLGISKILIQTFPCKDSNQLILQLPQNENFINFIEFNKLQDLGLDPAGLNIETCSKFAFLTEDLQSQMRINVLLVDPYHDGVEICMFRSTKVFDIKGRNTRDIMMKNIVFNTGKEIRMIQQQRFSLHQFMLKDEQEYNDIDQQTPNGVLQSFIQNDIDQYANHSEEFMYLGCEIPVKLSPRGSIYCILRQPDGLHQILQINKEGLSTTMCEMQQTCVNFDIHKDQFYYLTEQNTIHIMELQQANNRLIEKTIMKIKETDPCSQVNNTYYAVGNMIIRDSYLIVGSCTYYLYQGKTYEEKLMRMEQLTVDHKLQDQHIIYHHSLGPFNIQGSDQFACVFASNNENNQPGNQFHLTVHQFPDSQTQILVQDESSQVTMSTFLNEEEILVQIKNRFLLFNKNGIFKHEVHFLHTDAKKQEKRKLLQISENGYYFLFENPETSNLHVFTLCDGHTHGETSSTAKKRFEPFHKVNLNKKKWKHEMEHKCITITHQSMIQQKNVNNYGEIIVSQCHQKRSKRDDWTKMIVTVYKFTDPNMIEDSKGEQCICDIVYFKKNALNDLYHVLNLLKQQYFDLKCIEEFRQKRLPKDLRDDTQTQVYQSRVDYIKNRFLLASQANLFDDLIVAYCGRFIQFAKVQFTETLDFANCEKFEFKKAPIKFNKTVEICLLKKVSDDYPHTIQIIGKNTVNQVLTIITYNFDSMMEQSIFQVKFPGDFLAKRMILNGLNVKFNYLSDGNVIYDLEYNIPMQKKHVQTEGIIFKSNSGTSINTVKVYTDTTRLLNVMNQNKLSFPITKKDLLFWQAVTVLKLSEHVICDNVELEEFTKTYEDKSLFHHFCTNSDLIQHIHQRLKESTKFDDRDRHVQLMPITILHPDCNGRTALNWAINAGKQQSFELMVDMIQKVPNLQLITKMMLDIFPQMISNNSDELLRFFNSCTFQPLSVAYPLNVEWPADIDEFIFASPTILISQHMIEERLIQEKLLIRKEEIKACDSSDDDCCAKIEDVNQWMNYRSKKLTTVTEEKTTDRVIVEACDFDWVFIDNNAEQLLYLLSNSANPQMLIQKPIRIFIDIMWRQFEPVLFRTIIVPFLLFIITFVILVAKTAGLDPSKSMKASDSDEGVQLIIMLSFTTAALVSWLIFMEIKSISHNWRAYISDKENMIDVAYIGFVISYLWQIYHEIKGTNAIGIDSMMVRSHGAIACFLLWIKLYYFFRLLPQTAHYIRLTITTLSDIKIFTMLSAIIIIAFGNFFYIISSNIDTEKRATYFDKHIDIRPLDAFIQSYLVMLGIFDIDKSTYKEAPNRYLGTFFFLISSFIIYVVLMKMMIPIMQATYTKVCSESIINNKLDKLDAIVSVLWLRDLQEEFKGNKYIIRISLEHDQENSFHNENLALNITQKSQEIKNLVEDKFRSLETNVDLIMKRQQIILDNQNFDKSETQTMM